MVEIHLCFVGIIHDSAHYQPQLTPCDSPKPFLIRNKSGQSSPRLLRKPRRTHTARPSATKQAKIQAFLCTARLVRTLSNRSNLEAAKRNTPQGKAADRASAACIKSKWTKMTGPPVGQKLIWVGEVRTSTPIMARLKAGPGKASPMRKHRGKDHKGSESDSSINDWGPCRAGQFDDHDSDSDSPPEALKPANTVFFRFNNRQPRELPAVRN